MVQTIPLHYMKAISVNERIIRWYSLFILDISMPLNVTVPVISFFFRF